MPTSKSEIARLNEAFGDISSFGKAYSKVAKPNKTDTPILEKLFGSTTPVDRIKTASIAGLPASMAGVKPSDALSATRETSEGFFEGATSGIPRGVLEKLTGQNFSEFRGNAIGRTVGSVMGVPGRIFSIVSSAKLLKGKPLLNLITSSGAASFAASPEISEDPFDVAQRLGQGIAGAILSKPMEMAARGAMSGSVGLYNQARRMFPLNNSDKIFAMNEAKKEAEKITAQILQPHIKDMSDALQRGYKLPAIREGAKNISKVNNYNELVTLFDDVIGKTFKQRNALLIQNNNKINIDEVFDEAQKFISKKSSEKIYNAAQLRKMGNILNQELDFATLQPDFNVGLAQARKEVLQDATLPLLKKRSAGNLTGTENAELVMRDEIRRLYRKSILSALPKRVANVVDSANRQYEGLLEARSLASDLAAQKITELPKGIVEKLASSFGLSPKYTAARIGLKGLAGKSHISQLTEKVQNLRTQREALRTLLTASRKSRQK